MNSKRRCHKASWSPNRCVFSSRLNSQRLSHCRSLEGDEFPRRGAAVAKTPIAETCVNVEQHTSHLSLCRVRVTSEMSWYLSARYVGALPDRHWKTRTATLNWTRCCTGNQCSYRRIGVMWSRSRAAAFWTDCMQRISPPESRHTI